MILKVRERRTTIVDYLVETEDVDDPFGGAILDGPSEEREDNETIGVWHVNQSADCLANVREETPL